MNQFWEQASYPSVTLGLGLGFFIVLFILVYLYFILYNGG